MTQLKHIVYLASGLPKSTLISISIIKEQFGHDSEAYSLSLPITAMKATRLHILWHYKNLQTLFNTTRK